MKKILTLALTLFLSALPCFADLAGYDITNYKFSGVYKSNNTVDVVEEITVNFTEPRHGIYRSFPERIHIGVEPGSSPDAEPMVKEYKISVENVQMNGDQFKLEEKNDVINIKIGSASKYLQGTHVYTIKYTYVLPDDRYDGADFIFYSVLGADWGTTIDHFEFSMRFENGIPAAENFHVYSGSFGATENQLHVEVFQKGDVIYGELNDIEAYQAITLFSRVYEGYFSNEKISNKAWPVWLLFGLALAFSVAFIVLILIVRHKKVVPTVEFHPPEGLSSAEVGTIIDSVVDEKDISSLIPWFAHKGYLTIHQEEDGLYVNKVKELESDAPEYQKMLFNALFPESDRICLDTLNSSFGERINEIRREILHYFKTQRPLYKNEKSTTIFMFINTLLTAIFLMNNTAIAPMDNFPGFFPPVIFMLLGFGLRRIWMRKHFAKGRFIFKIVSTVVISLVLFLLTAVFIDEFEPVISSGLTTILVFMSMIANLFACRRIAQTDWNVEVTGKLMGLKKFIKTAEIDQLRMLVDENPEYFYDVLPYAIVFGLSDKWANLFTEISMDQPLWYYSSLNDNSVFTCMKFTDSIANSVSKSFSSAVSASSGSGGGGGGFSGGGGGGGGGGSW